MATSIGRPSQRRRLEDKTGWKVLDGAAIRRRSWWCVGFLALSFLGLLSRLWYLQVLHGSEMLQEAHSNQIRNVPLPAPRGLILDRRGAVLATSRASHSIAVVPAALPSRKREPQERARILKTLAFLLKTTPAQIEARLDEDRKRGGHIYDPVTIAENVDLQTITQIEENKARLGQGDNTAVLVTNDIKRFYPHGSNAAHLLGYTGLVNERDLERNEKARLQEISDDTDPSSQPSDARELRYNDIIGKNGLEKEYDKLLAGAGGSQRYEVDASLRPVRRLGEVEEVPGHTLQLTLDLKLQQAAEKALAKAANNGAVVAIDPRNGEVLAMASKPTFDPNMWSLPRKQFNARYKETRDRPGKPFIARATASRFPPGSTFKIITAAAGLEQGQSPDFVSFCNGGYRLNGRKFFGCWSTHGSENLYGAIEDSCNVHFYQMALKMGDPESTGPTYLAEVSRRFGLGSDTGIDLPGEDGGLIPDPAWRRRINAGHPDLARWYPGNTLNMSIGQGDVLATPLQMAAATAAVANGGTLWRPHLLKEARLPDGKVIETAKPEGKSVGIADRNLAIIRKGMRMVITNGTGKVSALPNVAVAGKTGSAEDANNALPHAWFVAYAPYDPTGRIPPQIAIAVIVENSGHGSANAAPIAKAILEAAFPQAKTVSPRSQ